MGYREQKPGDRFGGWTLREYIGGGGNGEVWRAANKQGDERALKVLKRQFRKAEESRYRRFRDEIVALRKMEPQSGILSLLDSHLPEAPSQQDPPWFVMPVAEEISQALGKSPPLEDVVTAIASIAETLAGLHAQQIFHRDIKPGNLYRHDGNWAVGDFGLVEYPEKEDITEYGEIVGPRFYMANEMLLDAKHAEGGPADVTSLAKTLWVLATGWNFPPPGHQRIEYTPYTIRTIKDSPRAFILDRLIQRSTDPDPKKRPTMAEFADELRKWLTPPEPKQVAHDFADLSVGLADLVEPAQNEKEEQQKLIVLARSQPLQPMLRWAESLRETLARDASFSVTLQECSVMTQIFGMSLPARRNAVWMDGRELRVQVNSGHSNCVIAGFAMWLYPNGAVHLGAGITLLPAPTLAKGQVQWQLKKVFQVASASQQQALADVIDGLNANIRPAMEELVRQIRNPPPNPLLGVIRTATTPIADDDASSSR